MNKEKILDILGDSDNRKIIRALGNKTISSKVLSHISGLPSSSFYRKLHELDHNHLISRTDNGINTGFNARAKYQNNITNLKIHLNKFGEIKIELETRIDQFELERA